MAKQLKGIMCTELQKSFRGLDGCVLINHQGLNSEQTQDLRAALTRGGVEMTVVHNRLARRVFKDLGMVQAFQDLFRGPTAVLYGEDGAISASKSLVQWRKKHKDLAPIKGGLFQGRAMSSAEVERLAALPDVATLRASCLSLLLAPLSGLPSAIQGLLSHFAGAVKARRESLEKGQEGGGA
ncbi:MAG: 50S ribosomal protein L10 [Planctomycetes bacterium]|nr:50S ribosomal protein L10 [Planctomycetota bacterium]